MNRLEKMKAKLNGPPREKVFHADEVRVLVESLEELVGFVEHARCECWVSDRWGTNTCRRCELHAMLETKLGAT